MCQTIFTKIAMYCIQQSKAKKDCQIVELGRKNNQSLHTIIE